MKAYMYTLGSFAPYELPEWADRLKWDEILKVWGYHDFTSGAYGFGDSKWDFPPRLDVYERDEKIGKAPTEFLCALSPVADVFILIAVDDVLSLAMLINAFAPTLTLGLHQAVFGALFCDLHGWFESDRLELLKEKLHA